MATVLSSVQLETIKNDFLVKWKDYDQKFRIWDERRNKHFSDILKYVGFEPRVPEYYSGYLMAVEMMEQIAVHASKYKFPDKLFLSRAPNETDSEYLYRRMNYKNTTRPIWQDYLSTISRSNADQNWSFSSPDERLTNYLNDMPKYGSLEAFLRNILTTLKEQDANGIIAVEPLYIPLNKDEYGNVLIIDNVATISDEPIKVIPVYYSCKNIVAQEIGEWYMVISYEKSDVEYNGKREKTGLICYIYDSENIYEFRQTGKKIDYEFTAILVRYPHNLGYVPCDKLKGDLSIYEGREIWISPFSSAADLLDLAILDESNLSVIKATTVYNYKVAIGTPCTFQQDGQSCQDGSILNTKFISDTPKYDTCPNCKGAGLKQRMSPFGVLLINPGGGLDVDGDSKISGDYLKLIGPPTEAPKLLRDEITSHEKRARKILHLPDGDSATTGGDGATPVAQLAKARATTAFIEPIATQRFTTYDFIIRTINNMMFTDAQEYYLDYPKTFDIETPSDYLAMIAQFIKDGLPPLLINTYIQKFFSSLMYTNRQTEAAYKLLQTEDTLLTMSRDDLNLRLSSDLIDNWRDTLHHSGIQILSMLLLENTDFFEQEYEVQRDQLIEKAKQLTVLPITDPTIAAQKALRGVTDLASQIE